MARDTSSQYNNPDAYWCPDCDYKTNERVNLDNHSELNHKTTEAGTIMEFKCGKCPKTYKIKMCLTNHARIKHGTPKHYQCTHCEYLTPHKGHWETHIKSVHEDLKETCNDCGKQFSNRSNVYRHKRKLHCKQVTHLVNNQFGTHF